ncbi:MAG: GNA1162 family protein [Thermodesulfobacteriota bacterium]
MLPMYNVTTSIDGAEFVRKKFTEELGRRHYTVMDTAEVNSILQEQTGISLGSQLEMITPEVLGEILGVDALVYGYLLDFNDITLGIYNARVVRAGFKMVDTSTGKVLWSRGKGMKFVIVAEDIGIVAAIAKEIIDRGGSNDLDKIHGIEDIDGLTDWSIVPIEAEKVSEAAIWSVGSMVVTKAFGVHLHHEASLMVKAVVRGLPVGPGQLENQVEGQVENQDNGKNESSVIIKKKED